MQICALVEVSFFFNYDIATSLFFAQKCSFVMLH